eukprot:GHVR01074661.1.p1 GENE.GHVR01074661.1~~GHVR01074661.1.p1  ORF type:complete len:114 (+),score=18.47 GHVR01074661.1:475-816(+)
MHRLQWRCSLTFLIIGVLRFCHPSVDAVADANDESGVKPPVQAPRKNTDKFDTPFCAPCDLKECPNDVTPETCEGTVIKDDCNCCPICQTAALSMPATPTTTQVTVTNSTGKI